MNKICIGLNTYLYIFKLDEKQRFFDQKEKLKKKGQIKEVFLNNELGFELKLYRRIYV